MQNIIIASGPIIIENKKILLIKDSKDTFWKFCGGRVENHDYSLFEAAAREAKEELGIEIATINEKPFIMHVIKENENKNIDVMLVHYLCKRIGEIKPGDDVIKWEWISIDKLEQMNDLAPNITPTLKHFQSIQNNK